MGIRIGETILSEDTTTEIREAIEVRIEGLKKTRKKNEDEKVFAGVHECDSKIECLRDVLRLIDPFGQIDGVAEAERGEHDENQQGLFPDLPFDVESDTTTEVRLYDELEEDRRDFFATAAPDQALVSKLTTVKFTGDEFAALLAESSIADCEAALATVRGQEGHAGRTAALEKRIAFIQGKPEGRYDFTEARLYALELIASREIAPQVAAKTEEFAPPARCTIAKKVAEWLHEVGLVLVPESVETPLIGDYLFLTHEGVSVAEELGYIEKDEEPEGMTVNSFEDIPDGNEEEDGEPVHAGAADDLDDLI